MDITQLQKKTSLQTGITAMVFTGLLVCNTIAQPDFKQDVQVYFMIAGLAVLFSLFAKPPFKTKAPFNIMLCCMAFVSWNMLMLSFVNAINPNDGWIEYDDKRGRVMQMNWAWGFLSGLIVTPLCTYLYHVKVRKNRMLEIVLATGFVISTIITYILSSYF